ALQYENLPLLDERVESAGQVADLGERYRTYLHSYGAKSLVQALTIIADEDAHPLVFHCSAGKDRTGVLAAMVLSCLGVPADEVVADYCAMQEERGRLADFLRRRPGYADLADHDPLLDSRPETMREFLRVLDEEYGGLRYSREAARVMAGWSDITAERGDWRFADPTWNENPVYRRLKQLYLAGVETLNGLVDDADVDWRTRERARFAVTVLTSAVAP